MTTTTKTRETWLDWIPPDGREDAELAAEPLLSREELVSELQSRGYEVSARDLIFWQAKRVIPYPVREKRQGMSIAVYPQWMIQVIHTLKGLQEQGYVLRDIGPLLRDVVFHTFTSRPPTPKQARRQAQRASYPIAEELDPLLRSFARVHELIHGGNITHAEIRLVGDDGTAETYWFPTGKTHESSE